MGRGEVIRASFPSRLEYRDLAIRLVVSACKLVPKVGDDFSNEIVSAFSEALNNVVLHGRGGGEVELELEHGRDYLTIRMMDHGTPFDPRQAPLPDLDALPESGLGAYIIRSCVDEIDYAGGSPNILSLTKRLPRERQP